MNERDVDRVPPAKAVRVTAKAELVPWVGAVLFSLVAVSMVPLLVGGSAVIGAPFVLFFGAFAVAFWIELLPRWIELDEEGLRSRKKFRIERIPWRDVSAVGVLRVTLGGPGRLLVKLTIEACVARGIPNDGRPFDLALDAFAELPQDRLLAMTLAHWRRAGGDGARLDLRPSHTRDPQQRGAPDRVDRVAAPSTESFSAVIHAVKDDGRAFVVVIIGAERTDAVTTTARQSCRIVVDEQRFNPNFSGEVRIALVPDSTPNTVELHAEMDGLVADLEAELARSGRMTTDGSPIRLSWRYGHELPTR